MITPTTSDLIRAVRQSFLIEIKPTLTDPVAESYARSIVSLLGQIEVRCELGTSVIREDNLDLRATLEQVFAICRSEQTDAVIPAIEILRSGLASIPVAPVCAVFAEIDEEAVALRSLLVTIRSAIERSVTGLAEDATARVKELIRFFALRQTDRDSRYLSGGRGSRAY